MLSESVLYVSEQVGFCFFSSFNRCFAKAMRSSPREWQKEVLFMESKLEKRAVVEYQGWMYPEQ